MMSSNDVEALATLQQIGLSEFRKDKLVGKVSSLSDRMGVEVDAAGSDSSAPQLRDCSSEGPPHFDRHK